MTPREIQQRALVVLSRIHRHLVVAGDVPMMRVMGRDIDLWDATLGALLSTSLAVLRNEWQPATSRQRARQWGSRLRHVVQRREHSRADVVVIIAHNTHIPPCTAMAAELANRGLRARYVVMGNADVLVAAGVIPTDVSSLRPSATDLATSSALAPQVGRALAAVGRELSVDETLVTALTSTMTEQLAIHAAIARVLTGCRQRGARHLLIGNDLTIPGRMAALIGRSCGWPSASPMHGVIAGEPLQGRHVCDRVLCWGATSRLDMIAEGEAPSRLMVVGAPGREPVEAPVTLHPAIGAWLGSARGHRPAVLVALSGAGHSVSLDHHRATIAALAALAAQVDVDVVVKLHPKDNAAHYRQVATGAGRFHLSCDLHPQPPFADWLAGMAAVITTTSASGADAILAGVPVICLDLHGDAADQDYLRAGAVHHAATLTELVSCVSELVEHRHNHEVINAAARRYVQASFASFGDVAAKRAVDAVLDSGHPVTPPHRAD